MRRSNLIAALLIVAICLPAFAVKPTWPTQNSIPIEANFGCLPLATTTKSIAVLPGGIASATNLGDYLPAGCTGFEGRVIYGDVVLGHANNLATGAFNVRQGKLYASGSTILWTAVGANATFTGKLLSNDTTEASITIDIAW